MIKLPAFQVIPVVPVNQTKIMLFFIMQESGIKYKEINTHRIKYFVLNQSYLGAITAWKTLRRTEENHRLKVNFDQDVKS